MRKREPDLHGTLGYERIRCANSEARRYQYNLTVRDANLKPPGVEFKHVHEVGRKDTPALALAFHLFLKRRGDLTSDHERITRICGVASPGC